MKVYGRFRPRAAPATCEVRTSAVEVDLRAKRAGEGPQDYLLYTVHNLYPYIHLILIRYLFYYLNLPSVCAGQPLVESHAHWSRKVGRRGP